MTPSSVPSTIQSDSPARDLHSHLQLGDLEWFIELGRLSGSRQYSLGDIRARQDADLTERIRQQALARIDERVKSFAEKAGFDIDNSLVPTSDDEGVKDPTKFE